MRKLFRRLWLLLVVAPIALVGLGLWFQTSSSSEHINKRTFAQIEIGMTLEEVQEVLKKDAPFLGVPSFKCMYLSFSDDGPDNILPTDVIWIELDNRSKKITSKAYAKPDVGLTWERLSYRLMRLVNSGTPFVLRPPDNPIRPGN